MKTTINFGPQRIPVEQWLPRWVQDQLDSLREIGEGLRARGKRSDPVRDAQRAGYGGA